MNEKNLDEIRYRRLAFRFFDKGKSSNYILARVPRSPSWLFKWKRRFAKHGWQAFDSVAKTPHRSPQQYAPSVVQLVLRVHKRLAKAKVGLAGARAVFFELKQRRLRQEPPSLSTIKRWLRAAGCVGQPAREKAPPYYPAPQVGAEVLYVACDWVARYLQGGAKVFVFHTLDLQTQALCQSIETNKSTGVACAHLLKSATELGLADILQLDNDAAFTGLGRKGRIFGRFVRLALYLGIEILFIPPAEPKRNSLVERVNGLWVSSFWNKDRFASVCQVQRKSEKFLTWYETYRPPRLQGGSVKQAKRGSKHRKLRAGEIRTLPAELPVVEGRVHFVRRVDEQGQIEILKERWRVSKQLRGEYVWATIETRRQSLRIYYCRSRKAKAKLVKEYEYKIGEPVEKVRNPYRRRKRRLAVRQIIEGKR